MLPYPMLLCAIIVLVFALLQGRMERHVHEESQEEGGGGGGGGGGNKDPSSRLSLLAKMKADRNYPFGFEIFRATMLCQLMST